MILRVPSGHSAIMRLAMERQRPSTAAERKRAPAQTGMDSSSPPYTSPPLEPADQEQRLVEQARRGDASAIEAIYRRHYDRVYRYVFFRLGSDAAAEDVSSQVFVAMVGGLKHFEWQGKPFIAWLYAIAHKQVAYYLRRNGRAETVNLEELAERAADTAGPYAGAEQREQRADLAAALRQLPDSQREVIVLRYLLSLSLAETAAALGKSEGAIKQLQLRGLAGMRGILSQGA